MFSEKILLRDTIKEVRFYPVFLERYLDTDSDIEIFKYSVIEWIGAAHLCLDLRLLSSHLSNLGVDRQAPRKPCLVGGVKGRNINDISFPGSPVLWTRSFKCSRTLPPIVTDRDKRALSTHSKGAWPEVPRRRPSKVLVCGCSYIHRPLSDRWPPERSRS